MIRHATVLLLALSTFAVSLPQQQVIFSPALSALGLSASRTSSLASRLAMLSGPEVRELERHLVALPERRRVQFTANGEEVEVTEGEKALLVFEGLRFVDVTEEVRKVPSSAVGETYPKLLVSNATQLKPLFDTISIPAMKAFLATFSGFYTRYFRSQYGRDSQLFLLDYLKNLKKDLNPKANVTFTEFEHPWLQKSIIARFEPLNGSSDSKIVIMGAHLDSTGPLPFLRGPGADDDGSGVTVLVSTFAALLNASFVPTGKNAVEFHFYSGEEGGLLGSKAVSAKYVAEGKKVWAMFHMDVTAFVKIGTTEAIGVIEDNVDEGLTDFMKRLIAEYAEIPAVGTKCGYGCSDHASWHQAGYPASIISEGKFEDSNTHMHSAQDTIDIPEFSFPHVAQFVRVAIGYAVELGGMGAVKK